MSDTESSFTPYAIIPLNSPAVAALKNLTANVQGQSIPVGYQTQARVGTYIPTGEDSGVELGVSGAANKFGNYKEMKPTGVDAAYSFGPNTISAEFNKLSPQDKELMLRYTRQF